MLRSGPAGLPGDLIATPLYHLPPRIADRIARRARLMAMGDLTEFGLPVPDEGPFTRDPLSLGLRQLSRVSGCGGEAGVGQSLIDVSVEGA